MGDRRVADHWPRSTLMMLHESCRRRLSHLHGECVAGVGASVDDVEGGDWQHQLLVARQVSQVLVQGNALLRRARLQ